MYYTSIEQSKKLLELGLYAYTADMAYSCDCDTCIPMPVVNCAGSFPVPCWSVGSLLKLLPEKVERNGYYYFFKMEKNSICYGLLWKITCEDIVKSLASTIAWLIENNYIKRETHYKIVYRK